MLIDALHSSLEDRIVALNRVGSDIAANIFIALVVHGVVAGEVLAHFVVPATFVGIDRGFAVHVGADDIGNFGKRGVSIWKLRADPPRSTSVRTILRKATPGLRRPLGENAFLPMKVSSASTVLPAPPKGARPPVRSASRSLCIMNQLDL
jgi:hypothetical protein